ncbi:MAG TPA: efflux RND transporter periplasmic adaptor subunit [Gemmataceae bacterium]|nr:efflux RND transporter periplasmic adaptor subunit [Gemmataceae bacterium]
MNENINKDPAWAVSGTNTNTDNKPGTLSDRVRSLRLPETMIDRVPRRNWLPWVLCLVFLITSGYFAYEAYSRPAPPPIPEDLKPVTSSEKGGSAEMASSGEVALESKGWIIPVHRIQISPKVSGMVMKLDIEEGKRVKKGEVLAELETVDYLADRDRAQAALEMSRKKLEELQNGNRPEEIQASRAELEEMKAQRDQLFLEWKRNNNLREGTAVAMRDYEKAYADYKSMERRVDRMQQNYELMKLGPRKERIDQAKWDVKVAEEELKKTQWRLDNCTVTAPISGTILTKDAEEGNIVNQLSFNLKGSLCDMADLSDLEVELDIQERDVGKVFIGQECRVRSEAFPDRFYKGAVSRLMPIGNRGKGVLPVRVKLTVPKEEEGVYLKPEMGAIVSFYRK